MIADALVSVLSATINRNGVNCAIDNGEILLIFNF